MSKEYITVVTVLSIAIFALSTLYVYEKNKCHVDIDTKCLSMLMANLANNE